VGYNEFKCTFIDNCIKSGWAKNEVTSLKNTLDTIVEHELPRRDNKKTFIVRDFRNSEWLKLNYRSANMACKFSVENNNLIVGTLLPAWTEGWRNISRYSKIYDILWAFFHLTTQYIQRSFQINIMCAASLVYDKACDFRGNSMVTWNFPRSINEYNSFYDSVPMTQNNRGHVVESYLNIINALDPFVNKAICYYLRMISLYNDEYYQEAIANADNVIDVIGQSIKHRNKIATLERIVEHTKINDELQLPKGTLEKLKKMNALRNKFASHPALAKWWDFSAVYENDIDEILDTVKTILTKFLQYESNNRIINDNPNSWAEWFIDNCDMVYDSTWFHRIPAI